MDEYTVIKKVKDEGLAREPSRRLGRHAYLVMSDYLASTRNPSIDQVLQHLDTLIEEVKVAKEELEAARAAEN